jgi:large conductance mechanosensitive channel
MKVVIQSASGTTKEVAITYGAFVNAVIAFLIISLAIFIVIKALERVMPKKTDAPPPAPPADVVLLTEIRDLLKQQRH